MKLNKLLYLSGKFNKLASNDELAYGDEFLYHVTYLANLESISIEGLLPGAGGTLGHSGNLHRSLGGVFLTDKDGVSFWYNRVEDHAEYGSDNILEDLVIPVVLRTVKFDDDIEDETSEGFGRGNQSEYKRTSSISPEDLELWDGSNWIPVEQYDSIDPELALIKEEIPEDEINEDSDEDSDKEFYYYFKDNNPLIPQL